MYILNNHILWIISFNFKTIISEFNILFRMLRSTLQDICQNKSSMIRSKSAVNRFHLRHWSGKTDLFPLQK